MAYLRDPLLLFNLYIHDLPPTISRKFIYADDITLITQHQQQEATEQILNSDLKTLNTYFMRWRLCPSVSKTEVCCFHLNSQLASSQLTVKLNNVVIPNSPKYLGVTLDRSLTFNKHLTNIAAKLKTRNNIIQKLTGTTWGTKAVNLRIAALGLVYPVAEYCAQVWMNSIHVTKIDTQLNHTMRLITGAIKPTPTEWLPVLSNIAPPHLRRTKALLHKYSKIISNAALPLNDDIALLNLPARLSSRRPTIRTAIALADCDFEINREWRSEWSNETHSGLVEIDDPTIPCIGLDLPRHIWVMLNRIRTNCGRCEDSLFRWNFSESPACDCGAERQTIKHIIVECPNRAYTGAIMDFNLATPTAIDWLNNLDLSI